MRKDSILFAKNGSINNGSMIVKGWKKSLKHLFERGSSGVCEEESYAARAHATENWEGVREGDPVEHAVVYNHE